MSKEDFIKLIQDINFIKIKKVDIEYVTKCSSAYSYGREEDKTEIITIEC